MNAIKSILTLCALGASVAAPVSAQMMSRPPVPMTVKQISQTRTGQNAQLSVRIRSVKRTAIYAEVLNPESDTVNRATGRNVWLYFADGTPVVMGNASDIRPGAILFVYGIVTKPWHIDVKRAAIDTKFITVK